MCRPGSPSTTQWSNSTQGDTFWSKQPAHFGRQFERCDNGISIHPLVPSRPVSVRPVRTCRCQRSHFWTNDALRGVKEKSSCRNYRVATETDVERPEERREGDGILLRGNKAKASPRLPKMNEPNWCLMPPSILPDCHRWRCESSAARDSSW